MDYEFVSEAMILKFACYTLSEYFGGTTIIRIYVPTALEQRLQDEKLKYIYFFNEENDFISNVILEYIDCDDPERKNQILLENN